MAHYTKDIRLAPNSEIVCYCANVTKGEILRAAAKGAKSIADIRDAIGACKISRCKELNPRGR